MMRAGLDRLTIRGFKSIERLESLELGSLNVLIGANGAGKSNFIEFFRVLRAMVQENLQEYMLRHAPADGYFYNGVKETKRIEAELFFEQNRYAFALEPTADGNVLIAREETQYVPAPRSELISKAVLESRLKVKKADPGWPGPRGPNWYVWDSVSSWQVYHFHDTGSTAGMRRDSGVLQTAAFHPNGDNLAAFLLGLRENHPETYDLIRSTVRRVAPYLDDFELRVSNGSVESQVRLTWKQRGKDYVFSPGHLSDGTIRFICLVTMLLQPSPPSTIVVDEPELGLHPEALSILAGLLRSTSARTQLIVATQSPVLLSEFDPEQVITVDLVEGASRFMRLDADKLKSWLTDYSLGELWLKGTLGGGVNRG